MGLGYFAGQKQVKHIGETHRYKGYTGTIEYFESGMKYFGQILGIDVLIVYTGDSISELEESFQKHVDNMPRYIQKARALGGCL